jgi:hypothetical protein
MGIGTRVDIDFSQVGINWLPGTSYTIQLGSGFVKEDGGEQQPSPANANFFSFTTNATGPVATSISPVPTTILVDIAQVTFLFDRQITLSTGNIKLYRVASPDVLVKTYDTSDSNISIGSNSSSIVLQLGNDINIASTEYYFLFDADVIRDADNFASPAVVNANLFRYTSGTVPVLLSRTPADGATAVTPETFTLTFDQFIKKGTGFIKLINTASGQETASLNVATSSAVTVNDKVVSVNFGTFILDSGTDYHITIDNNAILGFTGIPYAGLSNSTDWNFTTAGAGFPDQFIETRLYTDFSGLRIRWAAQAGAGEQVTPTDDNLINKTKGLKLYEANGTFVRAFYHGGTGQGTITKTLNNAISVFMSSYLEQNKTYYVLIDAGAYYNANTNLLLPAVTDPNLIRFNTNFGVLNLQNSTYNGNENNDLFAVAVDADFALVPKLLNNTQTYTIDLSSNIGIFSDGTSTASTYTISGTRNALTQQLADSVIFYPTKNVTSSGTMTLVLKSESTVLGTTTATLTYSGTSINEETLTFDTTTTWTPTFNQLRYRTTADMLLVGAGGAGHPGSSGGGGGGVLEQFNVTISNTSYPITIGAGGAILTDFTSVPSPSGSAYLIAANGQSTTGFGFTANGGGGGGGFVTRQAIDGELICDGGPGGTSGAPTTFAGGGGGPEGGPSGGGGGAGQVGIASNIALPPGRSSNAGVGIDSTIFGPFGTSAASSALGNTARGLGAGGNTYPEVFNYEFPRDSGRGGKGGSGSASSGQRTDTPGARGIVIVKLKS